MAGADCLLRMGPRLGFMRSWPAAQQQPVAVKRTKVLMVGWAGSRRRVLQRYAGLYHRLGYSVLFCCPTYLEIWIRSQSRRRSVELLDYVHDEYKSEALWLRSNRAVPDTDNNDADNDDNDNDNDNDDDDDEAVPLLLHVASGAPYVVASTLAHDKRFNVKGILWDCSPAPFTAAAVVTATGQLYRDGEFGAPFALGLASAGVAMAGVLARGIRRSFHDAMASPRLRGVPSQFVFYEGDPISTASHIRQFAQSRQDLGAPVWLAPFPDAHHVSFLKYHPREYTQIVADFVGRVDS